MAWISHSLACEVASCYNEELKHPSVTVEGDCLLVWDDDTDYHGLPLGRIRFGIRAVSVLIYNNTHLMHFAKYDYNDPDLLVRIRGGIDDIKNYTKLKAPSPSPMKNLADVYYGVDK